MNQAQRFEDLIIWQKSRELTKVVYQTTKSWPDKSLVNQIQRASVSVMSNIAEGFERGTKEEFIYFLYIARGSCGEVRSQLYVALDNHYINQSAFIRLYDMSDHTSRLIAKFISGYKLKGHTGQKYQTPEDQQKKQFDQYLKDIVAGKIKP